MSDDVLQHILDELKSARADREEMAAEIERMKGNLVSTPQAVIALPSNSHNRDSHGFLHLDPDTDEYFDPNVRAEMWRPDLIDTCACGQEQWARVIQIRGARDIRDAQNPQVAPKTGALLMQPHRFVTDPNTGEAILPDGLRLTPEKRAHSAECSKTHGPSADPRVQAKLQALIAEGVKVEPIGEHNGQATLDAAANAHAVAVGLEGVFGKGASS